VRGERTERGGIRIWLSVAAGRTFDLCRRKNRVCREKRHLRDHHETNEGACDSAVLQNGERGDRASVSEMKEPLRQNERREHKIGMKK